MHRTERGEAAAAAIAATSPGAVSKVLALDLADLASAHRFAAAVRSRWQAVDLLTNNASVGSSTKVVLEGKMERRVDTEWLM